MLRQRMGDNNVGRALCQRVEKDNVHRANNELKDVCQKPFTPETPHVINFLIDQCRSTWAGWACCLAAQRGNVETANFLIEERGVSPFQAVWGAADGRGGGVVLDYFLERYDMDAKHISSMEGETLLHEACTSGNHEMVGHLLRLGVDINARTNSNDGNETALDKAEYRWYDGMDDEEEEDERRAICIDILLQHGAVRGVDLPTPVTSSDDE
jgi:hypothetical protein